MRLLPPQVATFFGCEPPSNPGNPKGDLSITFTCDPDNRERLTQEALRAMERLQEELAGEEEVGRISFTMGAHYVGVLTGRCSVCVRPVLRACALRWPSPRYILSAQRKIATHACLDLVGRQSIPLLQYAALHPEAAAGRGRAAGETALLTAEPFVVSPVPQLSTLSTLERLQWENSLQENSFFHDTMVRRGF